MKNKGAITFACCLNTNAYHPRTHADRL